MDLKKDKVLDELNLKLRKLTNKFNNSLTDLQIIIGEIGKIYNNERLEIERTEDIIETIIMELSWKLRFLTVKLQKPNSVC